jgi:hypothetical protein
VAAALSEKDFTLNAEPGEYVVQGAPANLSVERVLDEVRLALLGVLLSIGLTVGFGVPGPWCVGVASGVMATLVAAVALRSRRVQRWLARLMHWVLGR